MKIICFIAMFCLCSGLYSCSDESKDGHDTDFELVMLSQKDIVTHINGQVELSVRLDINSAGYVPPEFYFRIKGVRCTPKNMGNKLLLEILPMELRGIEGETIYVEDQDGNLVATGPKLTVERCYRMVSSTNMVSDFLSFGSLCAYQDNRIITANLTSFGKDEEAELTVQSLDSLYDRYRINRLSYKKERKEVRIDFLENEKKYEYGVVTHPVIGGSAWSEKTKTFYTYLPTGYYLNGQVQEIRHRILCYREGNEQAQVYGLDIEDQVVDLVVDSRETVYILEKGACCIKRNSDKSASFSVYAGTEKKPGHVDGNLQEAQFQNIVAMAIDGEDNLYVAESTCIRVITPGGIVKTIAGTAEKGDRSGNLADVRFKDIRSMALAGNGAIYIIDTDFSRVKILNPERTFVEEIQVEMDADYLNAVEVAEVDDLHEKKVYQANRPMFVADNGMIYYMVPAGKYYYVNMLVPDEFVPEDAWYKRATLE